MHAHAHTHTISLLLYTVQYNANSGCTLGVSARAIFRSCTANCSANCSANQDQTLTHAMHRQRTFSDWCSGTHTHTHTHRGSSSPPAAMETHSTRAMGSHDSHPLAPRQAHMEIPGATLNGQSSGRSSSSPSRCGWPTPRRGQDPGHYCVDPAGAAPPPTGGAARSTPGRPQCIGGATPGLWWRSPKTQRGTIA